MKPLQATPSIIWLESVESTNNEIKRRISTIDNLSIIATYEQTAGRGQGEHSWHSVKGKNLTFSIIYRFGAEFPLSLETSQAIMITYITALAIVEYLKDEGIECRIKWPNDIWVKELKICGILIENSSFSGQLQYAIAGIGLNINQDSWPEELPNPVSMKQLSGKDYSIEKELEKLAQKLSNNYLLACSARGKEKLKEEFEAKVFRLASDQI